MVTTQDIQGVLSNGGGTLVGNGGDKLGNVAKVFLDDQTGNPEWVTVNTGMFGTSESFVPLSEATLSGSEIAVPYDKAKVKGAPRVDQDGDGHISRDQDAELYAYYELTSHATGRGDEHDAVTDRSVGHDTSGPNTDEAITRSEEQLQVGTEKVATGTARLRKFIVTENVTTTVPVSREEVRVVTEPINDANRDEALAGADLTSEEHEVTLHAERPVVDKEVVPVERVRLDTETVTGEQQVTEEVRKEQIESDLSDVDAGQTKRR